MKLSDGCASSCTSSERKHSYSTLRSFSEPVVERILSSQGDVRIIHQINLAKTFGTGEAIWSRVATVASNLTVSVSKAWAANLTTFVGEETPAGQESRLTRAMKAYHLEKSRDPTDLPTWLFDGSERCRLVSYKHWVPTMMTRSRSPRSPSRIGSMMLMRLQKDNDPPPPSRVTDRLKALRDAKRVAANPIRHSTEADRPKTSELNATYKAAVAQRLHVGLPFRPRRA
ncbi:hypothetical protein C0989_011436 [Termitomyces sp. Mn162]|nr:hypothetical protein C0989_011436 [Termitomyces sp. Mn162]